MIDEKTMIEIFGRLLDERDKRMDVILNEIRSEIKHVHVETSAVDEKITVIDQKIDSKTEKLRDFILENSSAIADILTAGLENTKAKVKKLENNITVLKQG